MTLDLSSLKKAVVSYEKSVEFAQNSDKTKTFSSEELNTVRAGVIQNFEFTFELCWKFMKRWLEANFPDESDADALTKKELFRVSAEHKLINETEKWFEFHKSRNLTAHIYDAKTAETVFKSAVEFLPRAKVLLQTLEGRND